MDGLCDHGLQSTRCVHDSHEGNSNRPEITSHCMLHSQGGGGGHLERFGCANRSKPKSEAVASSNHPATIA